MPKDKVIANPLTGPDPKMKSKNRLELLQGWSKAIKKTLSH